MSSSPNGVVGAPDVLRLVRIVGIVPELDALVERACYDTGCILPIPIDAVDLGSVCADGSERLGCPTLVPDVEPSIVRRGENVRILAIVFDLGSTSEPIAKGESRLSRSAQIPAVNITIDRACREHVRVVSREVDVGDGPAMAFKRVLNGTRARVVPTVQIPDEGSMIGSRDDPVVTGRKGRPLNINDEPRQTMAPNPPRRTVWRIQIDDGEAIRAIAMSEWLVGGCTERTYEARAMSRPDGEMVADPTSPST